MRLAGAVDPSERLHEVGVGVLPVPVHLEQHSANKERKADLRNRTTAARSTLLGGKSHVVQTYHVTRQAE